MTCTTTLDYTKQSTISCSTASAHNAIEAETVHLHRAADSHLAWQRGNPRVHQSRDHQRAVQRRARKPPCLYKMEPGRRCHRRVVVATSPRRRGRPCHDETALDARASPHRPGGLLRG